MFGDFKQPIKDMNLVHFGPKPGSDYISISLFD